MALGLVASLSTLYNEQTYSFCSAVCLAQFTADPERYLSVT